MPRSEVRPTRAVFGEGLRRLREQRGLTQEQVAERVRDMGWKATRVTIAKAEAGAYGLELGHVILLCVALRDATPADFVDPSGRVALFPDFQIRAEQFRKLLQGWRWPKEDYSWYVQPDQQRAAERDSARETEKAVAKQLGLNPLTVALISRQLWGKGLSERRDELAPADAGPTARGHVTRQLIRELQEALD